MDSSIDGTEIMYESCTTDNKNGCWIDDTTNLDSTDCNFWIVRTMHRVIVRNFNEKRMEIDLINY
jgi:hypothetical protein